MESLKLYATQWSRTVADVLLVDESISDKMLVYVAMGIMVAFLVLMLLKWLMPSKEEQEIIEIIEESSKKVDRLEGDIVAILNSLPVTEEVPLGKTDNPKDCKEITPEAVNKEYSFKKNHTSKQPNTCASLRLKKFKYVPKNPPNVVYKRKAIVRKNNTTNADTENFFESEYKSNYKQYN